MHLNTLKPGNGAKSAKKRVGRGIGSGLGKTCGRGHKGQKSRSGGQTPIGFEGGQMPLQRRLPKSGFTSRVSAITDEIRLSELNKLDSDSAVTLETLRNANFITASIKRVKIIASGEITKKVMISPEIKATRGARIAIEAAGGIITE